MTVLVQGTVTDTYFKPDGTEMVVLDVDGTTVEITADELEKWNPREDACCGTNQLSDEHHSSDCQEQQ